MLWKAILVLSCAVIISNLSTLDYKLVDGVKQKWNNFVNHLKDLSDGTGLYKQSLLALEDLYQICLLKRHEEEASVINVVVVACGENDRFEETLVNLKSIILFSKSVVTIHIFADEILKPKFEESMKTIGTKKYKFKTYPVSYPDDGNANKWKSLFKLCASQRLFLPQLLTDVDSIIYVDTDILFVSPVDEIWRFFESFNSTQLAAMSPEHEQTNVAWYSRFARHPYYGSTGINSGVMLMNLTRVRQSQFKNDLQRDTMTWNDMLLPLFKKYKLNITWGDQDLLNIIFHHNPEMMMTFPCKYNYRPDHCMYMPACKSAVAEGVRILHGCRRSFQDDKWPSFKAIYTALKLFDDGNNITQILFDVKYHLSVLPESRCKLDSIFVLNGIRDSCDQLQTFDKEKNQHEKQL